MSLWQIASGFVCVTCAFGFGLLIPIIGVDNRHKVAITTDSLSIKATDKLLPPTHSFASLASQPLPQEGGAERVEASSKFHDPIQSRYGQLTHRSCRMIVDGRSIIFHGIKHQLELSPGFPGSIQLAKL